MINFTTGLDFSKQTFVKIITQVRVFIKFKLVYSAQNSGFSHIFSSNQGQVLKLKQFFLRQCILTLAQSDLGLCNLEATSRHISPPGDSPLPKVGVHFKGSGGGRIIPPIDLFTFLCLITCLCCFNNSAAVTDWIMVLPGSEFTEKTQNMLK